MVITTPYITKKKEKMDVTNDQADSSFNTQFEHNTESKYNTESEYTTEAESKTSPTLILATATVPLYRQEILPALENSKTFLRIDFLKKTIRPRRARS